MADLNEAQVKGIVDKVLDRLFGGVRKRGGSEDVPPEWQAQLKRIVAGEIDVGDRGRLMFDVAMVQLLTHQANLNSMAVNAGHTTQLQNAIGNWGGVSARSMWRDRITNPDEVAHLTETMRKNTPVQLDALSSFVVAEVMRALRQEPEAEDKK